jgi:hypothetical protein
MTISTTPNRKAIASITLLITWEIWNEMNARISSSKHVCPLVIFDKKKDELWVISELMSGE